MKDKDLLATYTVNLPSHMDDLLSAAQDEGIHDWTENNQFSDYLREELNLGGGAELDDHDTTALIHGWLNGDDNFIAGMNLALTACTGYAFPTLLEKWMHVRDHQKQNAKLAACQFCN